MRICFMGVLILILSYSSTVMAWHDSDKILEIKVADGNKTLVRFQNATWHSCGGSSEQNPNPFFIISEGDDVSDQRKQMLSIALSALMANKNIWVVTGLSGGNAPQCSDSGYEWVYQISIYPN